MDLIGVGTENFIWRIWLRSQRCRGDKKTRGWTPSRSRRGRIKRCGWIIIEVGKCAVNDGNASVGHGPRVHMAKFCCSIKMKQVRKGYEIFFHRHLTSCPGVHITLAISL